MNRGKSFLCAQGKHSFLLEKVKAIPELGLEGFLFRHEPSKATLLHLSKPDRNCVFSLGFRTFPADSTGAPHILEHLALCGSRKYPVRDPFFKMLSRSLATYMNAWTSSDWTMYPFSTQNPTDYANLRDIYVDATFAPGLAEADFRQEGWRLERAEDGEQWRLMGVVYNEMKGVFSDTESLFSQLHQQTLLPGSIYGHVSGGHPRDIPQLSHARLLQFWRQHYNPANCLSVSYGDGQALDDHLAYMDRAFHTFTSKDAPLLALGDPLDGLKRLEKPWRTVIQAGAVDPLSDPARQVRLLVSFMCNPITDVQGKFNMQILASLLLEGPSSPFHQALIDSNIGSEYAAGTGYDSSLPITSLSVGLQGIQEEDIDRVESLIMATFQEARTGKYFIQDRIDAVLHQIELRLRYHSASFGIGLAQKATSAWVHALCPLDELDLAPRIAAFKEQFAAGGLFEGLLDKYVLNNPERLTFVMKPDVHHQSKEKEAERRLVNQLVEGLSEPALARIEQQNGELCRAQERHDPDKHLLPCLSLADISKTITPMPYSIVEGDSIRGQLRVRMTAKANGLGYFKAKIPITAPLEDEEIVLLPLLMACWTEMGVRGIPIDQFDQQVRLTCAGLGISIHQERPSCRADGSGLSLVLSTHALSANLAKAFDLFRMVLVETEWQDLSRLRTQLAALASGMSNGIASSGHSYAKSRAASKLSEYRRVSELLEGLAQLDVLNKLLERKDDLEALSRRLETLARKLFTGRQEAISFALVADQDSTLECLSAGARVISNCLGTSQSSGTMMKRSQRVLLRDNEMTITPFATNFVAKCFLADVSNGQECANLAILSRLLPPLHLHKEIREKGGAYGGGSSFSRLDGLFTFYSYRDPTPVRSLQTIDGVGAWLRTAQLTDQDLLEARLSVFSDLDAPHDVSTEGLQDFLYGMRDAERQEYRDALLGVTLESVRKVAEKYLDGHETTTAVLIMPQHEPLFTAQNFTLRSQ